MKKLSVLLIAVTSACAGESAEDADETVVLDSNDISYGDYIHDSLPENLLGRIKATTDVFEPIDRISFEQAVDMYRRDLDPEANLIIWEARVGWVEPEFIRAIPTTNSMNATV